MPPIRNAHVPPTPFTNVPCRIQGLPLNMSDATRREILQLIKYVRRTLPESITHVRPISLISDQHGNLQAEPIHIPDDNNHDPSYPARYRISPYTICNLNLREQIWRSENFALGTLLYELHTGQETFDGQSDEG